MLAAPDTPSEIRRLAAVQKAKLLGTPAEERFDRITRLAKRLFGVPMACLDIVGDKVAWLKSVQGFDGIEGLRKDSYCHYTVQGHGLNLVRDARLDPRVHDSAYADTWVFYAGVPLRFDGEQIGVLCIGDHKPREFDADQMDALSDLAALAEHELQVAALSETQVALALSNEELEMKSRIDVLTHLWNRGAIMEVADTELAAASEAPLAALLIDIDHFKAINDTYGHLAGDQVLRLVAERLRAGVRPTDAVGRYGGEEFLAVLSGIGKDEALLVSERIRQEVARTVVSFSQHHIPVSCSIGCALSTETDTVTTLIGRADQALYRAKVSGRNRVEFGAG